MFFLKTKNALEYDLVTFSFHSFLSEAGSGSGGCCGCASSSLGQSSKQKGLTFDYLNNATALSDFARYTSESPSPWLT